MTRSDVQALAAVIKDLRPSPEFGTVGEVNLHRLMVQRVGEACHRFSGFDWGNWRRDCADTSPPPPCTGEAEEASAMIAFLRGEPVPLRVEGLAEHAAVEWDRVAAIIHGLPAPQVIIDDPAASGEDW